MAAKIDKEEIRRLVKKRIDIFPQVFVEGDPIGGHTEFSALMSTL